MANIGFKILAPDDRVAFDIIAKWYLSEWKIPIDKTINRLRKITTDDTRFQVLMTIDNLPIATGGLYHHVGLLDNEPKFEIYKNWLALVYTRPDKRHQGYGALICNYIQDYAKRLGVAKMFLYTDTAESLYKRLGWVELERLSLGDRNIVVMRKIL